MYIMYVYIYIYIHTCIKLHRVFHARHVRTTGNGGEVRHGVTSGVSHETSLNRHVTHHHHRE